MRMSKRRKRVLKDLAKLVSHYQNIDCITQRAVSGLKTFARDLRLMASDMEAMSDMFTIKVESPRGATPLPFDPQALIDRHTTFNVPSDGMQIIDEPQLEPSTPTSGEAPLQ